MMERESLFNLIALMLGIGAIVMAFLSISTFGNFQDTLNLYTFISTFTAIALFKAIR